MRLAENRVTDARSFMKTMGTFPGTENWFYADDRSVAFQQSGRYPRHTEGSNVDLPFWGDGRADWQRFDPVDYTFRTIPPSHRPRALDPPEDMIISWNNKEAPGWRKGPGEWSNGPVHRAMMLERRLKGQARRNGGKVDLTGLTRAVNMAATADLRGDAVYPWMRRVIGRAKGEDEKMLRLLDAWHRSGSNRLDSDDDNVYEHSAAVILMDAWWPRAVRAEFEPVLGEELFNVVEDRVLGFGGFGWDWGSQVQKDLRGTLGKRMKRPYSRRYCGTRKHCRKVLLGALREAVKGIKEKRGDDPGSWELKATCDDDSCDQIEPNTAGAVATPPFPWQNRGTFHQIDEITSHRGE
jgi:acyl-homoserine lactone acylase PvdQ